MFSKDPIINDIVLTIVNDGNGKQCGASYEKRLEYATRHKPYLAFRAIAREYGRRAFRSYGTAHPTLQQTSQAGNILADYYAQHLMEMEPSERPVGGAIKGRI